MVEKREKHIYKKKHETQVSSKTDKENHKASKLMKNHFGFATNQKHLANNNLHVH